MFFNLETILMIIAGIFFIGVSAVVFFVIRFTKSAAATQIEPEVTQPDKAVTAKPSEAEKTSSITAGLDMLKWFVGTVVLGLYGTVIANQFKNTELELKRMETDAKLIEAVSAKFDTSADVQYKYLDYIQPFITTDSLKKGVAAKLLILRASLTTDTTNSIQKNIRKKVGDKQFSKEDSAKFKGLNKTPTPENQKPIAELKKSEKEAAGTLFKTSIDTGAVQKLNNLKKLVVPVVVNEYVLEGSPETLWAKKGYFVLFNSGQLKIGVNDVDRDQVELRITLIRDNDKEVLLERAFLITPGKSREILDRDLGYRYDVSLDYVGSAGRNPLTKAAYITVSTYKKSPVLK